MADAQRLKEESRIRERFVRSRLTHPASPDELKDLTDFFHTASADLLACNVCTLLVRDEHDSPPAHDYSQEEYAQRVMEHQYPKYVEAFRKKENAFRSLLPQQSQVLEIGSHYGAFLQVATEWGWSAEGVDPGKDTSRFAKSRGFQVHVAGVGDCNFPPKQFDAVFIWNCFEQIEEPQATLRECHRILKRGGLLTVRTPDGHFYLTSEKLLLDDQISSETKDFLTCALGYNNLLGFPYRYGYSRTTFSRLIEPLGFRSEGALSSELLTFPLPENPQWVQKEERRISENLQLLANSILRDGSGESLGPWLEAWFRAV